MRLEELVPPLELCKLIPDGEFPSSAFVRCISGDGMVVLCERKNAIQLEGWKTIPAPTLEEILQKINSFPYIPSVRISPQEWFVYADNICSEGGNPIYGVDRKKVSVAAFKAWFQMKGI